MTEITSPQPLYSSTSSQASASAKSDASATLSSDFETFLRMLTVQVQNQDPLNPVDATDYATQLATFSSVEQQVLTNDLLSSLNAQFSGGAMQEASSWIGMDVLVTDPIKFDGTPIRVQPEFATNADSALMLVKNAAGQTVQEFELTTDEDTIVWSGLDANGDALPEGPYQFVVESYKSSLPEDELLDSFTVGAYGRVEEVRANGDDPTIRLFGGTFVSSEDVLAVRWPQS